MLYLLPTPLGNLADITLHTLNILDQTEVFLCEDTRVSKQLLSLLQQRQYIKDKERVFYSFHTHNQEDFLKKIQKDFFFQNVVFMSDAGMPCISDPGSVLINYAREHCIEFEVLLGGSAPSLAFAYSGFGDRGYVFDSFLPHKKEERKERLRYWHQVLGVQNGMPLVCFESPHRLLESLADLGEVDCSCKLFAIKEMTKKFQKSFLGNIKEVLEQMQGENLQGEWCLVIDFSKKDYQKTLTAQEVLELPIAPKLKSKILSKLTNIPIKEWYERLLKEEE
ncbi:16S rRNA (cytidine(1402)-2'-O)-methyltransferase [Helicobacter cholecystus]|uniref:16S rRNA (cytidine(1402)-2'-O)-methyltransferase n=1 Tax=Helicobacter cholecystus TaxID=45498 RepID=UPI000F6CA632|nr:16S rRNA (cytidine(1402)-2'-O)-methyltransferase [Helicobacter cholecystus]VEJ24318.1 methylase [Helicobacter cholecystus]